MLSRCSRRSTNSSASMESPPTEKKSSAGPGSSTPRTSRHSSTTTSRIGTSFTMTNPRVVEASDKSRATPGGIIGGGGPRFQACQGGNPAKSLALSIRNATGGRFTCGNAHPCVFLSEEARVTLTPMPCLNGADLRHEPSAAGRDLKRPSTRESARPAAPARSRSSPGAPSMLPGMTRSSPSRT